MNVETCLDHPTTTTTTTATTIYYCYERLYDCDFDTAVATAAAVTAITTATIRRGDCKYDDADDRLSSCYDCLFYVRAAVSAAKPLATKH